ncbi:DUF1835 domain-containing protein [Cohnella sp. GCM10012308]|uniref:DUF1835 domain-containing protein n=1 Tax=Cohnella sp. GCM10012308 TaxID=3317329 RepID=UPI00361483F7
MLHIVNGDHVGNKLREGNIRGDILVWREVYPAGPVFAEMYGPEQRTIRARYLERTMGISAALYEQTCRSQESRLLNCRQYDEIVLWFEHDLFDQLMLSFLLHWFAQQPKMYTALNLLCIGEYPGIDLFKGLGQLTTDQLLDIRGTWRRIGQRELDTGAGIWDAYASSDIKRHAEWLEADMSALPFAHAAFDMHLSRLPSAANGLGIVEQTIMSLIREGARAPLELFEAFGNRLHALGMGDLEFRYRLTNMLERPNALIALDGEPVPGDSFELALPFGRDSRLEWTELGEAVMAGEADWLLRKGIDEWYGGLHLHGVLDWRWDSAAKRPVDLK